MSQKSIDRMKQIIEDKKNKDTKNQLDRPDMKASGSTQKAFKNLKRGGAFDK